MPLRHRQQFSPLLPAAAHVLPAPQAGVLRARPPVQPTRSPFFDGYATADRSGIAANSGSCIVSFWYWLAKTPSGLGANSGQTVFGAINRFNIGITSNSFASPYEFVCGGNNPALAQVLGIRTLTPSGIKIGQWGHFLASWNLATATAGIYLDDVLNYRTATPAPVLVNDVVDYALSDMTLGSNQLAPGNASAAYWNGYLAEVYLAPGQFLDFSVAANRRKFITADLKAAFLGSSGSLPTGSAPASYHYLLPGEQPNAFFANRGAGGGSYAVGAGVSPGAQLRTGFIKGPPVSWTRPLNV